MVETLALDYFLYLDLGVCVSTLWSMFRPRGPRVHFVQLTSAFSLSTGLLPFGYTWLRLKDCRRVASGDVHSNEPVAFEFPVIVLFSARTVVLAVWGRVFLNIAEP